MVSASALCVLATALVAGISGASTGPRFSVPDGFTASVYVRDIPDPHHMAVRPDGTLTLSSRGEAYEILPPANGEPMTILRVDPELARIATPPVPNERPGVTQLSWSPVSGELIADSGQPPQSVIPVAPRILALARTLGDRHHEVALAPDGSLFVADWSTDAIWRLRLTSHSRT